MFFKSNKTFALFLCLLLVGEFQYTFQVNHKHSNSRLYMKNLIHKSQDIGEFAIQDEPIKNQSQNTTSSQDVEDTANQLISDQNDVKQEIQRQIQLIKDSIDEYQNQIKDIETEEEKQQANEGLEQLKKLLKDLEEQQTQVTSSFDQAGSEALQNARESLESYEKAKQILEEAKKQEENENENESQSEAAAGNFLKKKGDDGGLSGSQVAGMASACLKGILGNIPPSFCYKRGADAGVIPNKCPSGWDRKLALCYQRCGSGYYHFGGVCWQSCPGGYHDHGATCYRHFFSWFFKHSYIPGSITNFDSRVQCQSGYYKGGALCYRDCAKVGLMNCGIGACASSSAECASAIITMLIDAIMAIAKAVLFIASFGTSSAGGSQGATAAANAAKKAGQTGIKFAVKHAINVVKRQGIKAFTKKVVKKAKEELISAGKDAIMAKAAEFVCNNYVEAHLAKMESSQNNVKVSASDFDFTGISGIADNCSKNQGEENNRIACSKSVLQSIDLVDPTGLTALGAAFLQPICDV